MRRQLLSLWTWFLTCQVQVLFCGLEIFTVRINDWSWRFYTWVCVCVRVRERTHTHTHMQTLIITNGLERDIWRWWMCLWPQWCFTGICCKELPNKDHSMCRKERFIGSTDCWADPRVQGAAARLEWVGGFIGGATLQGREGVPPREQLGPWPPFTCDHQIERVNMRVSMRS
jgi:hypothetical protein